jgi:hypothetical protein
MYVLISMSSALSAQVELGTTYQPRLRLITVAIKGPHERPTTEREVHN